MTTNNISVVTDILTVARDSYKNQYDALKKAYELEVKQIKQDFKSGTPRYNEELENAKFAFENNVDRIRKEAKDFTTNHFEELRENELAKVRRIDTDSMAKLSAVANLPLSAAELSVLQDKYAPKGEYWATRMIADLAEKNGLKPSQFLQTATLDTKLNVLQQLEGQLDKLLAEYDGEVRYDTLVLLHDEILMRAERTYMNGWALSDLEDSQVARRLFLQLNGKNVAEQGIALQNIANNTTPEVKRALFFEMENHPGIVESGAMRWAGIADEFESYQKNEHKSYTDAKKAIDKAVTATSKEEIEQIANELGENTYFQKMLSGASESNIHVSEYLLETQTVITSPQIAE